jgi:acyl carrier protein
MTKENPTDHSALIKRVIVESLELPMAPDDIEDEILLFAPAVAGGMELDSLAAIEIIVGLSNELGITIDEIPREAFASVRTLSNYLDEIVVLSPTE